MEPTTLITDAPGSGFAYLVRLPYRHMPFVRAFKEQIPEKARDWHPRLSAWLFRRTHLDVIRQLVAQHAEAEGWRVLDTTVLPKEQAALALQKMDQQKLDAHIAAALDVLSKLPANVLELAGWLQEVIILDVNEYLEEALFTAFIAAGYPDRKYAALPYISTQNSKTVRVIFANNARIVSELLSRQIQYLSLQSNLSPVATFDDGVIHWHDHGGTLWFGAPYMQALEKQEHTHAITRPGETYRVVVHEGQIYLVASAEEYIQSFNTWGNNPFVSDIEGRKASNPMTLSASLHRWHLEAWFIDWAHQVVENSICTPYSKPHFHRWFWENANYWIHPAQSLIGLLHYSHEEETQEILGWPDAYVQAQHERIKQIKAQHARDYLQYCREHATELAAPELRSKKSKDDLLQLGEQYDIPLRKSWTNQRMIEVLTGSGQKSERLAWAILEIPDQVEEQAIRS